MRRNDVRLSKNLEVLQISSKKLQSPTSLNEKFKFSRPILKSVSPSLKNQKLPTETLPLLKSSKSSLLKLKKLLYSPQLLKKPEKRPRKIKAHEKPQLYINPKDSFDEKYNPKTHEFFHKVIGKIQISMNSFRLGTSSVLQEDSQNYFQSGSPASVIEKKVFSTQNSPRTLFEISSQKILYLSKFEIMRKVFAAVSHYKNLNLHQLSTKRIYEYFPGVPYGIKNSQNFIKAVKDGDLFKVAKMLHECKWLAHVFDYTGQTPLHWAVIRNHFDIAKLLLELKAFVDVNDYVRVR